MNDCYELLKTVASEKELSRLKKLLCKKSYLEEICECIMQGKNCAIGFDTWKITLGSLTDIDTLVTQLSRTE
jgi:hypothetical protein